MRRILLAAAAFTALAVIHTWPLATSPARLSRFDTSDAQLNAWIVSWVAHQLPRDPRALFDANIFYPEPNTLALSEPLIVPGVLAIPLRGLGASPVLVYNLLLFVGFVSTALGTYILARWLTDDQYAGLLAGSIVAFNSHTLTRLPHLQAVFGAGIPLAVWLVFRLMQSGRLAHAGMLAIVLSLTAATSGYMAAFAVLAVTATLVAGADVWWGRQPARVWLGVALAALGTMGLLWPLLGAYGRAHDQGLARSLKAVASYAAVPASYLTTLSRIHFETWSKPLYEITREKLFPGVVAYALALAWLSVPSRWVDVRSRILLAIALAGFVFSLGPATPVYRVAYQWIQPVQDLRAVGRFGYLTIIGVSGLAALGLAHLRRRLAARRRMAEGLGLATIVVANLEAVHAPMPYVNFEGFSPIYKQLAGSEPGAVIEYPFHGGEAISKNAPYVLASTEHWRPLVNGYSGAIPESFARAVRLLRNFPTGGALRALRRRQVRYVVVHVSAYDTDDAAEMLQRLERFPELELLAEDNAGTRLYHLRPE